MFTTILCVVCTTAFYTPGNLADAMMAFRNSSFNARPAAFVKGIRVKTLHLGYKKSVRTLSNKTARQHKFLATELGSVEVTVEEYFKRSMFICPLSAYTTITECYPLRVQYHFEISGYPAC